MDLDFKKIENKLVRDNETAVLLSQSYRLSVHEYRYDPVLIELILQMKDTYENFRNKVIKKDKLEKIENEITEKINKHIIKSKYRVDNYSNLSRMVRIEWVPVGTYIQIVKCADNGESIVTIQMDSWDLV
jgi:hypothetical protein